MIAEHVQSILQVAGINAVVGELPGSQTNMIAINEYTNGVSTEYFGNRDSSTVFNPVVKIVVRNLSYAEGQRLVESAARTLHRLTDDVLLSSIMVGSPTYLGKGVDHVHEFQVTFNIQTKE